jgi:hypothetical protein
MSFALEEPDSSPDLPEFRFLTNHGNTLLLIARDARIRIRDIASLLDITERAAQRIVADLSKTGYLLREREGRRNVYSLKTDLPLHLPFQRDIDINALLGILGATNNPSDPPPTE